MAVVGYQLLEMEQKKSSVNNHMPMLPVKGMIPVSMLDWEGKLATVLFTGGCNFKCSFCHNADLVVDDAKLLTHKWEDIEKHLTAKKEWLDGVVITGGEPTIHKELKGFIQRIKQMGYPVKLDTNGALPGVLRELIQENIVDYVAMDIKTTFTKYEQAVKTGVNVENVIKSVSHIRESGVEHEFRTTVVPGIVEEKDTLEIAEFLTGSSAYYLQQFKPDHVLEPQASHLKPYPDEVLFELAKKCNEFVPTKVRNI